MAGDGFHRLGQCGVDFMRTEAINNPATMLWIDGTRRRHGQPVDQGLEVGATIEAGDPIPPCGSPTSIAAMPIAGLAKV